MSESIALFENFNNQRWSFSKVNHDDVSNVAKTFDIHPLIAKMLIHNLESVDIDYIASIIKPENKLQYELDDLVPSEQLENAVKRIRQAQINSEIVYVNGDPDADGIGGTAILVAGLRQLGLETKYIFPIRPTEGHGLQIRIIEAARDAGSTLIFTADCGTKDVAAVEYANSLGIDVIITDHHILGHKLPNALAIINPYLNETKNLYHDLAGSSISFKFIQAVFKHMKKDFPEFLYEFGMIVSALGSISDRVSLLNPLNRLIVSDGVKFYRDTDREGVKVLRKLSEGHHLMIKPRHLSRTVVPRLNAPGRIGNPEQNIPDAGVVVDLLLLGRGKRNAKKAEVVQKIFKSVLSIDQEMKQESMKSNNDAFKVAVDVNNVNEKRKYITAKIQDEMDVLVDEQVDINSDRVIIVEGRNWNSGVIGIDTDRLKERFLRPAIILTSQSGSEYVRGSCRSIPRINMYNVIDNVDQSYQKEFNKPLFCNEVESLGEKKMVSAFGGHAQACGFTLHRDNISYFKENIEKEMLDIPMESFEYHYDIIDKISFSDINLDFIKKIDEFSPYGQKYAFPIFYLESCLIRGGKVFGNKYQESVKNHVRFQVENALGSEDYSFSSVGFNLWEKYCFVKENSVEDSTFDLIFTIEIDPKVKTTKLKHSHIRLNVLDIRLRQS
tara:strand:+ start:637 stop:2637 length:2001 start_codon:yes stop_codon:yes gene_type:complete